MTPRWLVLWIGEGFNPRVKDIATNASGAYAIRDASSHVVRYVGESSTGTLWKTLLRHFQAPDSFRSVRERGIFTGDPRHYDVAIHVTSRGPRPRPPAEGCEKTADGCHESKRLKSLKRRKIRHTTKPDAQAKAAQAKWIATLHPTVNVDDGGGEEVFEQLEEDDYFSQFNPALPPPNVAAERRAENRTPDIFTGRTRLEDGGKARRDWKGEAERTARELAECRRGPAPVAPPRPPPMPAPKPEGYGTTDEKGQSRMFKGNPRYVELDAQWLLAAPRTRNVAYRAAAKKSYDDPVLLDGGAGPLATVEERSDPAAFGKWIVASLRALDAFRSIHIHIPGPTTPTSEEALFWTKLSRQLPKPPAKVEPFQHLPWSTISGSAHRGYVYADGSSILDARDRDFARLVAMLGGLAHFGVVLRKVPDGASQRDIRDLMTKRERSLENAEAARKSHDAQRLISLDLEALQIAFEATDAAAERSDRDARFAREQAAAVETENTFLARQEETALRLAKEKGGPDARASLTIEGGGPAVGSSYGNYVATADDGHGRLVASANGSTRGEAWGRLVDALIVAPVLPKVEGYGVVETSGRHAGQSRLFNPPPLVELGLLTRLDLAHGPALEWSLRDAPILAYLPDAARAGGGALVICYRGPVVRSSTRAELREYGKKHWGAAGPGNVRDCGVAVAPWKSLGPSTSITYTTKKGRDGAPIDYVHLWHSNRKETPPRVDEHRCKGGCKATCAAAGSIRLSGGTYSVEDRGIVG